MTAVRVPDVRARDPGDVVWFARCLAELKCPEAHVVFLPRADMQRMSWRIDGIDHVLQEGEPLPPLDVHTSLMSLATRFGTTLSTIPSGISHLRARAEGAARWEAVRVGAAPARRHRLGRQARSAARCEPFAAPAPAPADPARARSPLAVVAKGPAEVQLESLPGDVSARPLGARFGDLDDLVSAMSQLDLVISVCTGPAHIAGAMGLPVWTMVCEPPDMRWLVGREDSPWYPSMRLFRQRTAGHWDDVVERVAAALEQGTALDYRQPAAGIVLGDEGRCAAEDGGEDRGLAQDAETPLGTSMTDVDARDLDQVARAAASPGAHLGCLLALARPGDVIAVLGAGIGAEAAPLRGRRSGIPLGARDGRAREECSSRTSPRTASGTRASSRNGQWRRWSRGRLRRRWGGRSVRRSSRWCIRERWNDRPGDGRGCDRNALAMPALARAGMRR